jgi:hypothetical protein
MPHTIHTQQYDHLHLKNIIYQTFKSTSQKLKPESSWKTFLWNSLGASASNKSCLFQTRLIGPLKKLKGLKVLHFQVR